MSGRAVRSRLLELRREREAARTGREVLEQKLELLRRELLKRTALREKKRDALARELSPARDAIREARIELGRRAVEVSALVQPEAPPIEWLASTMVGVSVPILRAPQSEFRACFGPGGTAASLDEAAKRFASLIPALIDLASEEAAARALHRGLRRTARRLNALEKAVLPRLDQEMRDLSAALEEEEREERSRRDAWLEMHA